jgi:hypothetical protein
MVGKFLWNLTVVKNPVSQFLEIRLIQLQRRRGQRVGQVSNAQRDAPKGLEVLEQPSIARVDDCSVGKKRRQQHGRKNRRGRIVRNRGFDVVEPQRREHARHKYDVRQQEKDGDRRGYVPGPRHVEERSCRRETVRLRRVVTMRCMQNNDQRARHRHDQVSCGLLHCRPLLLTPPSPKG